MRTRALAEAMAIVLIAIVSLLFTIFLSTVNERIAGETAERAEMVSDMSLRSVETLYLSLSESHPCIKSNLRTQIVALIFFSPNTTELYRHDSNPIEVQVGSCIQLSEIESKSLKGVWKLLVITVRGNVHSWNSTFQIQGVKIEP
ncbi:MAG: hypothetical protein QW039_04590 [Fervidicoccaceae archaeon]